MSRRFVLNNGSCTTVNFSCDIQRPFHIEVTKEKISTSTKGCKKKTGTSDRNENRFSLKPNANLEVRSVFLTQIFQNRDMLTVYCMFFQNRYDRVKFCYENSNPYIKGNFLNYSLDK